METLPKDVSFKIMDEFDDNSLLNFCSVNKQNKALCNNETFWRNRTYKKYASYVKYKNPARTWKNYYLSLVYYLNLEGPKYMFGISYALQKAAENNDEDIVNLTIDLGGTINYGFVGAVTKGHKKLTEFFIEKLIKKESENIYTKPDISQIYENGLAFAAEGGQKDLINFFIGKGANNWNLGMSYAAEGGHRDLVDFFIGKGAKDWEGGLVKAAIGGHKDLVDFFVAKGAKEIKNSIEMSKSNKEMVKYLKRKYSHLM